MKRSGLWTLGVLALASGALAQQPKADATPPELEARAARLQSIMADRAGETEEILNRWRRPNAALGSEWEAEFREIAGKASADKLLAASEASTYQGAVDALLNGGRPPALPGGRTTVGTNALGDTASDLVYFPLTPCRILDTRIGTGTWHGPLAAGSTTAVAHNQNLAAQGGNPADCGVPTDPAAIVATVTAVSPSGPGNLRLYATGTSVPLASTITYTNLPGLTLANTTIVPTGQILGNDFNIGVFASATDVVVDVAGYFWSPVRPVCRIVTANVAPTTSFSLLASCASTESYRGGGCNEGNWLTGVWWWQNGPDPGGTEAHQCRGWNTNAGAASVTAYAKCCTLGR
jgi:hypothetical protein